MTTVPYYISETVYSPSLRAGAAAARRGRPIAGGRRSIDLRPKYLNPIGRYPIQGTLKILVDFPDR